MTVAAFELRSRMRIGRIKDMLTMAGLGQPTG